MTLESTVPVIHVWVLRLWHPSEESMGRGTTLSEEEMSRANLYRSPVDRSHFIAVHEAVRRVLSRYLHCPARSIQFTYDSHGKPRLENTGSDLRFNHSSSNGVAVLAVAGGREVGVDTEFVRDIKNFNQVAAAFFTRGEASAIRALPQGRQLEAFYACWTRKEAFCKAVGAGLMMPLDSFEVSVCPSDSAQLAFVQGLPQEADNWRLLDLTIHPLWRTALCFQVGPSSMLGPKR